MADPTGESKSEALRLDFDRRLMLQFRGSVITSDGGLLAYRELDDVLALTTSGGHRLAEARTGKNRRHLLVGLLRQSIFGRFAGYEDGKRRRAVVPRSGDALGGRRRCTDGSGCLGQPDGALRDRVAGAAREPRHPRQSAWGLDRYGAHAATAEDDRARHGFEREPDLWRTGRQRLQWPFRLYLLPPAVRVQPAWRSGAVRAAIRQRPQRRRLAGRAGAGSRPLPGHGEAPLFPRRCGLRQSGDLRVPRSRGLRLCDPAADQPRLAGRDRLPALASRRRPSQEVRRYYASFTYQAQSWKKTAARRGQGRVASRRAVPAGRLHHH